MDLDLALICIQVLVVTSILYDSFAKLREFLLFGLSSTEVESVSTLHILHFCWVWNFPRCSTLETGRRLRLTTQAHIKSLFTSCPITCQWPSYVIFPVQGQVACQESLPRRRGRSRNISWTTCSFWPLGLCYAFSSTWNTFPLGVRLPWSLIPHPLRFQSVAASSGLSSLRTHSRFFPILWVTKQSTHMDPIMLLKMRGPA